MNPLFEIGRQATEGAMLCGARMTFGDEQVAEWVFDQEYDADFVGRHSRQLGSLFTAHYLDGAAVEAESDDD